MGDLVSFSSSFPIQLDNVVRLSVGELSAMSI